MKEPADELKSLFNEAFAREEVGFDMADWDRMQTLLMKRDRRRVFVIWLSSALLFLAASTALMALLFDSRAYVPRTFGSEVPHDPASTIRGSQVQQSTPRITSPDDPDRFDGDTEAEMPANAFSLKTPASHPQTDAVVNTSPAETTHHMETTGANAPAHTSSSVPGVPGSVNGDREKDTASQIFSDNDLPVTVPEPVTPTGRQEEFVTFMPPLPGRTEPAVAVISRVNPLDTPAHRRHIVWYVSAGLNKSVRNSNRFVYQGMGQRIAFGASRQFREHFFLASELSLVREAFMDTIHYSGSQAFGFTASQDHYTVNTTELLYLDIPVIASYRNKRLYLGGGAALGYLLGVKNEVLQTRESRETVVLSAHHEQYYRWDRYRNMHLSLLADAQYQLSPVAFIGMRGAFGLTDVIGANDRAIRKTRLELYLKLNIK